MLNFVFLTINFFHIHCIKIIRQNIDCEVYKKIFERMSGKTNNNKSEHFSDNILKYSGSSILLCNIYVRFEFWD